MPEATRIPRYRRTETSRRELLAGEALAPATHSSDDAGARALSATATNEALPPLAVIALNRMGFGPRPGDIAAFNALGANDDDRLNAYIQQQLNPPVPSAANDPDYFQRRNGTNGFPSPGFSTLGLSLTQLWTTYRTGTPPAGSPGNRPVLEVRLDTLMRMTYSKWQLREVLADFWHNHFNVYGFETYTQETLVAYDRDVVRAHMFGNFREMIEAVAQSTTMLYFLDNYTSTVSGPNENYARENFELHTLGAENYYGTGSQSVVPAWPGGAVWPAGLPSAGQPIPAGYVDNDVYEAARSFTGWSVNPTTGVYTYNSGNHDNFQKAILSFGVVNMQPNQAPEVDGNQVLDILAAHPGTGRHIARKLCRRLVSDNPPDSLVNAAGDLFTAQRLAPDQLKQVVQFILESTEFRTTWGEKIKRPVEYTVSALRAASANWQFGFTAQNPLTTETDTNDLLFRQSKTGHNLFARVPPDGFADQEAAWSSTNTRLQCFRLGSWLIDQSIDSDSTTDDFRLDVLGAIYAAYPSHQVTSNQLVDFWIPRVFGRDIDPEERAELVDFMAQGNSPTLALNLTTSSTVRSRVRSLVGLMFMLPAFLSR
ncbi:MAG: DUF1800 domain-containing protein [Thermoanaerobaculia bacterium]